MDFLSIIGSIASIIALPAAYISWKEARKSKSSADEARSIVSKIRTAEISEFDLLLNQAFQATIKYQSGNTKGANREFDIEKIQEFNGKLTIAADLFEVRKDDNPAIRLHKKLNKFIEKYRVSTSNNEIDNVLKEVHIELNTFRSISKTTKDKMIGAI